ncbi:asparagine synthase (glutamine-hydrolyzing) [Kitasatospora sp. NPDC058444]|uniref:asparagine synthase (glutamine-hydrolyzing) n=1 Tax=Kitasatospora sp. NPDC058444 TaxID=3346504 RepID=UPI003652095B
MCGIAGWYSPVRDLVHERATVEAMTDTMALRGPDAGGVWLRPRVALGHRRLAVIDIEGGAQPMVVDAAGGEVALTYSGELYNFRELRDELRRRGHRFGTASDTEVVLRSYLEWGEAFVERLNGIYAFAIWDGRTERLLLIRDRLGVKPLYHYRLGDDVLFGSEPKAILANPAVPRAVDLAGLREAFSWIRTPGHAVWRGMSEVRPGTLVTVDRDGLREHTYWELEATAHEDDTDTTVERVHELLSDIIRRQLVTDVPRCTLLSGGLDSSVITAFAQRELGEAERIRSFSVDFAQHGERFTADRFRDSPDAPFAREVAERAGTLHTNVVLDAQRMAAPEVRRAVVGARDLPTGFGDADNSLYLLFQEIRKGSTVALSGESADEVFGGYKWMHDPSAQHADDFPWVNHTHVTSPHTGIEVFTPELRAALDLPEYIRQGYADAVARAPRLAGESGLDARMRTQMHLHLTRYMRILLDRKDRLSMAAGLEVRVPFCDHRLVSYVFNTPWSMKTFDGAEKSLLRAAARDELPRSVIERRKAPYPSTQDPAYTGELLRQASDVLADGSHPVQELTDRRVLKEALGRRPEEVSPGLRTGLERWLDMATWLDIHRPTLQPA